MIGWRSRPGFRTGVGSPSALPREHQWPPELDEDAELRSGLAALGAPARRQLRDVLTWPEGRRDALLRSLFGRPGTEPLSQLIAIADTDTVVRLRLLRAIRDLG